MQRQLACKISTTVLPEVNVTATRTVLSQGDDVTLTCNITRGNPSANTYTWTRLESSFILTAETSPILRFSSIALEQFGSYRCEVRNSVGIGRDSVTIEFGCESQLFFFVAHILYTYFDLHSDGAQVHAPEFVIGLETSILSLYCNSTGIPTPTITWTVSNQSAPYPQSDSTISYRVAYRENSYQIDQGLAVSSLSIGKPQYSVDHGVVYTCIGSNINGEDSTLITLQIIGNTCWSA